MKCNSFLSKLTLLSITAFTRPHVLTIKSELLVEGERGPLEVGLWGLVEGLLEVGEVDPWCCPCVRVVEHVLEEAHR